MLWSITDAHLSTYILESFFLIFRYGGYSQHSFSTPLYLRLVFITSLICISYTPTLQGLKQVTLIYFMIISYNVVLSFCYYQMQFNKAHIKHVDEMEKLTIILNISNMFTVANMSNTTDVMLMHGRMFSKDRFLELKTAFCFHEQMVVNN